MNDDEHVEKGVPQGKTEHDPQDGYVPPKSPPKEDPPRAKPTGSAEVPATQHLSEFENA